MLRMKSSILSHSEEKFLKLMELDGITPQSMKKSLALALNRKMVFKAGQGAGQSGSFFFFSSDNKYIIKTLRGNEKDVMLRLLDDYI
jgi:1-phosphatidylinositol-4-phosphate 5-kinase